MKNAPYFRQYFLTTKCQRNEPKDASGSTTIRTYLPVISLFAILNQTSIIYLGLLFFVCLIWLGPVLTPFHWILEHNFGTRDSFLAKWFVLVESNSFFAKIDFFFHLESRFSLYSQRSIYNVRFGIFFFQLIYVYFVIYLILWTSHPEYGKIQFQDEHFDLMNDFDNEMNLKQRENISFSLQKLVDSTKSSINWLKFAFIKQAQFNSCSDGWIMYFTMWQRNKAQFFFVQFNQKYAHFEFLFSSSFHQFATARIESRRIVNR